MKFASLVSRLYGDIFRMKVEQPVQITAAQEELILQMRVGSAEIKPIAKIQPPARRQYFLYNSNITLDK